MFIVLDWVVGSGVVVDGQSHNFLREFTLQNHFEERVIRDLGSGLFQSAMNLHLSFLDSSLD